MKKGINTYIKEHSHINYCEAILYPDGTIEDVKPNHVNTLIRYTGKSEQEIYDMMPITESPIYWLVDYTKCVAVWYNGVITPEVITEQQQGSLDLLRVNKIIADGTFPRIDLYN